MAVHLTIIFVKIAFSLSMIAGDKFTTQENSGFRHINLAMKDVRVIDRQQHGGGNESLVREKPSNLFLMELFKNLEKGLTLPQATGHDSSDYSISHADTIRSFSGIKETSRKEKKKLIFTFNISTISEKEQLRFAELRLKLPQLKVGDKLVHHKGSYRLGLKMKRQSHRNMRQQVEAHHKIRPYKVTAQGFLLFDVTTQIGQYLISGRHSSTLMEISLKPRRKRKGKSRRTKREDNAPVTSISDDQPLIVVYSEDKDFFKQYQANDNNVERAKRGLRKKKKRRHYNKNKKYLRQKHGQKNRNKTIYKPPQPSSKCSKHSFFVDFDDIGWGKWIVYPKRFNAHFCHGNCPSPVDQQFSPTNHAIMQSLMRLKHPDQVPEPCCVPIKLQPLSMLYYEYDEIVVRHHDDMIVGECGCR